MEKFKKYLSDSKRPIEDHRDGDHDSGDEHQRARIEPPRAGAEFVDDHVRVARGHRVLRELQGWTQRMDDLSPEVREPTSQAKLEETLKT